MAIEIKNLSELDMSLLDEAKESRRLALDTLFKVALSIGKLTKDSLKAEVSSALKDLETAARQFAAMDLIFLSVTSEILLRNADQPIDSNVDKSTTRS